MDKNALLGTTKVYTPEKFATFLAENSIEMWQDINQKQIIQARILDPACGTGNLLVACYKYIEELYYSFAEETKIIGADIDIEALEIAKKRLPIGEFHYLNTLLSGEKLGKFDLVIANPPYLSCNKVKADLRERYKEKFKTYYGRADLYILFIEQAWNMLNENGVMSFVVPETWLTSQNGRMLREMFSKEKAELYIVDIPEKETIFKEQVIVHFIFAIKRESENITYVSWDM